MSYSCLPNFKQTIFSNNHRLLQLHRMKESTQNNKLCNSRQKNSCLLDRKSLIKCAEYKSKVKRNNFEQARNVYLYCHFSICTSTFPFISSFCYLHNFLYTIFFLYIYLSFFLSIHLSFYSVTKKKPENCSLKGKCLIECVVYKATNTKKQRMKKSHI